MTDDATLLHAYAQEGSETAFRELVGRHVDFVFATAQRRVGGDVHLAADVAQQVFTRLAREARQRSHLRVLSAWLHTATRNAAVNVVISEQRRRAREQAALDPAFAAAAANPEWEQLRPVLDAAIDELPEPDRAAVVLRFLEHRPFAEIGAALNVTADAARMRTERALEKLRATLARRGISSTSAAVSAIVSSQPVIAAPAGLVGTIAAASLATAGAGAGVGAVGLVFTSLMKLKTLGVAAGLLVAFGAGTYVGWIQNMDTPLPPTPDTSRTARLVAGLRQERASLRAEVERLAAANARLQAPRPAPPATPAPRTVATPAPASMPSPEEVAEVRKVYQQRAMLNNLRMIRAGTEQFELENKRSPTSIHELVGPDKYIRSLTPVDGEDYSTVALGTGRMLMITSPNGVSVTYDPTGGQTTKANMPPVAPQIASQMPHLGPAIEKALAAYRAAHNGRRPPDTADGATALIPYFATTQEGADYAEYVEYMKQSGRAK